MKQFVIFLIKCILMITDTAANKFTSVYKMYASRLERLGIKTLEDFLYHLPFRYEDFSQVKYIKLLHEGEMVTVRGVVKEITNGYTKSGKKIQKAVIEDESGTMEIMWFNQPYLAKSIHKNDLISLSGRVGRFGNNVTILSPEFEIVNNNRVAIHTGRLVPIYPETNGVSSKWLRRQVYNILKNDKVFLQEYLPDAVLISNKLHSFNDIFEHIHFPEDLDLVESAKNRLAFDELFLLQLSSLQKKHDWRKKTFGNQLIIDQHKNLINNLVNKLPFVLTDAQQKAVEEIFKDLGQKTPMNRLLQGDVGSGKTIVATIAMYLNHLNGYQSVLMAPTEILAQQHHATIENLLKPLGIKVDLITGSKKSISHEAFGKSHNKEKEILDTHILIGTHAVLNEDLKFKNLGLVIIDEQQRFGVEQRAILRNKGNNPHLLTMTATPIPRTVALTMYGELELSYLDEMPKNRKRIKTWFVPRGKRNNAYQWIRGQIRETDSQVFIICPFIEESENMQTVKAATKEFDKLKKEIFPDLKLGLLHGKLKPKEKDEILDRFKAREFDILVATPVVEVGIDIPNATIIVIEGSERFGLSQLHQLRGRVGRGDKQSYCLLFTETNNPQTINKLKSLETIHNGAELAELDLKLRGPGDIFGIIQSGIPVLKIASFSDTELIIKAKREAEKIFPDLEKYPKLKEKLKKVNTKQVSPD